MTPDEIEFKAESQGAGKDDQGWKHYLWRVMITLDGRSLTTDYRMGEGLCDFKPITSGAADTLRNRGKDVRFNHFGPGRDALATPSTPTARDVLESLALDARCGDQSFHDFCMDLGYDEDSRKAYATYEACRDLMYELRRVFGGRYDDFLGTEWDT